MQRTPVNPWPWSLAVGYNQAEIVEGARRLLVCAGQTGVDGEGRLLHPGDMRAQMALALDNVAAVLAGGGMGWADVVKLTMFVTDVPAAMASLDLLGARLGPAGVMPPVTLIGVSALADPAMMVEVEATAAD